MKRTAIGLILVLALIGLGTICAFCAIKFGWTKTRGIVDSKDRFLNVKGTPAWAETPEWQTLEKATTADAQAIHRAAAQAGVSARLIVAQLVSEQLRLYNSDREIYKEIFAPLQILGVQSQYSWGVMGMKQDTAILIEENLQTPTSTWYLGKNYEHMLDFSTTDHGTERFDRLTNEKDHFYSYLYTGLFLKQIMTQWKNAGYDISARPEVLSTLYNIGFLHSKPNATPNSGGAEIEIGGKTYSFGDLAAQFYYSDKLLSEFPR